MSLSLDEAFAQKILIRPTDRQPNLVHLVRAVATIAGVKDIAAAPATRELVDLIGPAEHLIFVLLDGLGMMLVEHLPRESFLARSLAREIHATCPSTTACALTTVTTGEYPSRHAVPGWFTYLPDRGISIATLPFVERFTGEPLVRHGIRVEDVLPMPSLLPRMTHDPLVVSPSYIAHTPYNIYSRGGTPGVGYSSISEGVDQIIARVSIAHRPTYTHLYLPEVDSICHHKGVEHPDVVPLVMRIDAELARLAEALRGKARIVVSADHGLIEVPRERQVLLQQGDPLLELLVVPPTGDARMPIFHLRENRHAQFVGAFNERFGNQMILLETAEAEHQELFGPGKLSAVARPRFGDFVAIPFDRATLSYQPPNKTAGGVFIAVHAGLSPEEMRVPLCIS